MLMQNDELLEKLQSICGDECDSVTDAIVTFSGIAATGKKGSVERKENTFAFEIPTENLMLLAENAPTFLAVAVRQMLTDARNKARQTLEGKGMPKYTAKVIGALSITQAFKGQAEELVEALGYTWEQYADAQ